MWEIYDDLISGIPENLIVDELLSGSGRSYVRSGNGSGIASFRLQNETRTPLFSKNLIGKSLREVATCVKSWNFAEASIGAAAINAYYNNPQVAKKNGVKFSNSKRVEDGDYPIAPVLFGCGIEVLTGFMIKDNERALKIVSGAENVVLYTTGQKVSFKKSQMTVDI